MSFESVTSSHSTPPRSTISTIVAELRRLRLQSLEHRQRLNNPPKLPSRKMLANIIDSLSAALFPNRLGMPDLTDKSIDFFVGYR